jgi:putative flippase GtrA
MRAFLRFALIGVAALAILWGAFWICVELFADKVTVEADVPHEQKSN